MLRNAKEKDIKFSVVYLLSKYIDSIFDFLFPLNDNLWLNKTFLPIILYDSDARYKYHAFNCT